MSTGQYLSWEDLQAEEEASAASDAQSDPAQNIPARVGGGFGLPEDFELPGDLRALFAERERLERELRELTGEVEPQSENPRVDRMFQVKVHTKETRIEERRERQREEQKKMLEKRRVEARLIQARLDRRRDELRVELRNKVAEEQRLRERWARERRQAREEAERKRALEAAWQLRHEMLQQARKAFWEGTSGQPGMRSVEAARDAAAQRALEARKAEALARRTLSRRNEQQTFDERQEAQRLSAMEQAVQRRREARAVEDERESVRQRMREQRKQDQQQVRKG